MEITQKEIQTIEGQISPLIEQADGFIIDSIEAIENVSPFLRRIKDMEKVIEDKRIEFTKPLNQSLKAINETFKKLKEPLVQARTLLTGKILNWKRIEAERIAREEAKRERIANIASKVGIKIKPVEPEKIESKIGNVQTRKVWTWQVTNWEKVPDEYKELDTVAINQAIRDGVRDIKGLKIYQEEKLAITRG